MTWCQNSFKGKSQGPGQGRGAMQVESKILVMLSLRCMTMPVGVKDSDMGRFQVQGNTRFKAHSSAGAVHGSDKGMLGYKVRGSAKTRLELYGSVRIGMKINTGTRQE